MATDVGPSTCNLSRLGTRIAKRLTCEVHLNVGRTRLPDQREIIDTLDEVWAEANRFITHLGERE